MAVEFSLIIGFIALAVIGTRCVETILTTFTLISIALINVLASFAVLHQLVALVTLAIKAGQSIHAFVFALISFGFGAFVNVAVSRLVRGVIAIYLLVAHSLVRDALPVFASELGTRTGGHLRLALWLIFVTSIATIILAIAQVRFPDTFGVLAGEFLRRAGTERAISMFVGAVSAIVVVVTDPFLIDTTTIFAPELVRFARFRRRTGV